MGSSVVEASMGSSVAEALIGSSSCRLPPLMVALCSQSCRHVLATMWASTADGGGALATMWASTADGGGAHLLDLQIDHKTFNRALSPTVWRHNMLAFLETEVKAFNAKETSLHLPSAEDMRKLGSSMFPVFFPTGTLFDLDTSDSMYFITKGECALQVTVESVEDNGKTVVKDAVTYGRGSFFGESGFFEEVQNGWQCRVRRPLHALQLSIASLQEIGGAAVVALRNGSLFNCAYVQYQLSELRRHEEEAEEEREAKKEEKEARRRLTAQRAQEAASLLVFGDELKDAEMDSGAQPRLSWQARQSETVASRHGHVPVPEDFEADDDDVDAGPLKAEKSGDERIVNWSQEEDSCPLMQKVENIRRDLRRGGVGENEGELSLNSGFKGFLQHKEEGIEVEAPARMEDMEANDYLDGVEGLQGTGGKRRGSVMVGAGFGDPTGTGLHAPMGMGRASDRVVDKRGPEDATDNLLREMEQKVRQKQESWAGGATTTSSPETARRDAARPDPAAAGGASSSRASPPGTSSATCIPASVSTVPSAAVARKSGAVAVEITSPNSATPRVPAYPPSLSPGEPGKQAPPPPSSIAPSPPMRSRTNPSAPPLVSEARAKLNTSPNTPPLRPNGTRPTPVIEEDSKDVEGVLREMESTTRQPRHARMGPTEMSPKEAQSPQWIFVTPGSSSVGSTPESSRSASALYGVNTPKTDTPKTGTPKKDKEPRSAAGQQSQHRPQTEPGRNKQQPGIGFLDMENIVRDVPVGPESSRTPQWDRPGMMPFCLALEDDDEYVLNSRIDSRRATGDASLLRNSRLDRRRTTDASEFKLPILVAKPEMLTRTRRGSNSLMDDERRATVTMGNHERTSFRAPISTEELSRLQSPAHGKEEEEAWRSAGRAATYTGGHPGHVASTSQAQHAAESYGHFKGPHHGHIIPEFEAVQEPQGARARRRVTVDGGVLGNGLPSKAQAQHASLRASKERFKALARDHYNFNHQTEFVLAREDPPGGGASSVDASDPMAPPRNKYLWQQPE
ncbi:hypothetical protein CYMTET_34177, partial [Cymbomonas tetramitiformis]